MAGVSVTRAARLSTGIEALDRMIYGIPNGSVILLSGKLGSGFDIFAQQVLYNGALTGSCTVRYLTLDRTPEDVESEIQARKWDLESLLTTKKWTFQDLYSVRLNIRKGVAGAKALTDILNRIPSQIEEGSWTAFDTLTYLVESLDFKEVIGFIDDLVVAAREKGGMHFLMMVESLQDERLVTSVAHSLDGFFSFALDSQAAEPTGNIRVLKLRKTPHATRLIPYRITETGINIETVTRVA